jgi:hypothetical protein
METIVSRRAWLVIALASSLLVGGAWLTPAQAAPVANFSRTAIPFAFVAQGVASPTQPVFVTNIGDAALVIGSIALSGPQPADFIVSGTCGPPVTLQPNERCRIDVVMKSFTARGKKIAATVTVQSNAATPSTFIALTGDVDTILTGPIFVPAPEWLDFTAQPVGSPSPPLTMTITNATSLTYGTDQFALAGGDASDFTLTSNCAVGQQFVNGQTCIATVTFTPQAAGPRSTELVTEFSFGDGNGVYRYSITGVGGTVAPVVVVEYYNESLDHYFITWLPAEQANLDAGNTPTRWVRTGYSFKVYTTALSSTSAVCRYYLPPLFGDSHFFGRGTTECNATGQQHPAFVLEDPMFMHIFLPVAGICPPGTAPVYRVFSNRPDANHRYMTDRTVRDQMVVKGWLAEGDGPDLVVMCAPL